MRIPYKILVCISVYFCSFVFCMTCFAEKNNKDDVECCKKVVIDFLKSQSEYDFNKMYTLMDNGSDISRDKKKFLELYEIYKKKKIKLKNFDIVKVEKKGEYYEIFASLYFSRDLPPRFVSGVYKFKINNESGRVKIKYVTPPLKPPSPKNISPKSNAWN